MNIVLFGFKSVGKTHFGKLLSKKLTKPFIDTDQLIEATYKHHYHENLTCRQIYMKLGETSFRLLEKEVIKTLKNTKSSIIALGGGTLMDSDNYSLLSNIGKLIYLDLDKQMIKERISKAGTPSFLESFESAYTCRKAIYDKINAFKIELNGKADHEILREIEDII